MERQHTVLFAVCALLFSVSILITPVQAQLPEIEILPPGVIEPIIPIIPDLPIFVIPVTTLSGWAIQPPAIDGIVSPDEWNGAGEINLFNGTLLLKNDAEYLYLLVDLTGDTVDDPPLTSGPWGDYFWLTFDVDADAAITPSVDINYGTVPGTNDIRYQYYLSAGTWTGLQPSSGARLATGFGASPLNGTAHRIWEVAVPFTELDIDFASWLTDTTQPLITRLGLRTYSQNPSFSDNHPANFWTDFTDLLRVSLAASRPYPNGPIFSGVGLIPSTQIVDGYATTPSDYYLPVVDAPFGSNLHIFGNFAGLHERGATQYRVLWNKVGDTAPAVALKESWKTYKWDPAISKFVTEFVAPDSLGRYTIPNAADIYLPSLSDLLVTWRTGSFDDGLYRLQLEAFNAAGATVLGLSETGNELVLAIDNTRPVMNITTVSYGATTPIPIGECEIVYLGDAPDGLRFTVKAWDAEHHLYNYALVAHYGDNKRETITSDSYASNVDAEGPNWWSGVDPLVVPDAASPAYRPPQSCAYQFRLSGWARSINGYHRIHHVAYNKHITVLYDDAGTVGGGLYTFALSLDAGLNLVSLPVQTDPPNTARSLLGTLGGTFIIGLESGSFVPFFSDFPGDGFPILGGKGYIVQAPSGGTFPFTGTGWGVPTTPDSASTAPEMLASGTWAFAIRGQLEATDMVGPVTIKARNLQTGQVAASTVDSASDGHYAAAWADLSRADVVSVSDVLEITIADAQGAVIAGPVTYQLKQGDIRNAFVTLPIQLNRARPEQSALLPNYPNPFNPETWIPFALDQDADVVVRIFSSNGESVRGFELGQQRAGYYTDKAQAIYWDGTNGVGERVASGLYFYTIRAGNYTESRRMLIVK